MPKSKPVHFRTEAYVLGIDEDGEPRTTVKAVEAADPQQAEASKLGNTANGCHQSVLTALHMRGMTGPQATKPFRPRDILEILPPEIFGTIAEESRVKAVTRALVKLADRAKPLVEKAGEQWRLVHRADRSSPPG